MSKATVTSGGRVTIPKTVRDLMQISAGDKIDFVVTERGEVVIHKLTDVRKLRGLLKRRDQRGVSVEEMRAAILRQHAVVR